MKVILLADIPKVGNRYDVKDFKQGYAENVLLSKGLAELATPQALARLESRKAQIYKKKEEEIKIFNELISSVNNKKITIKAKANEKGHLFKAVSQKDIVEAIQDISGIEVKENSIVMDHIKELGSHTVKIKKGDIVGNCEIIIEAQK
jgi:large subunit ribosomal protein L9